MLAIFRTSRYDVRNRSRINWPYAGQRWPYSRQNEEPFRYHRNGKIVPSHLLQNDFGFWIMIFFQVLVLFSFGKVMELLANNKKLALEGFLYTQHSKSGTSVHWRCVKRGAPNHCPCTLTTNIDFTFPSVDITKHTHAGDATAIEVTKARLAMRENANRGKPAQVFSQAVGGLSPQARGRVSYSSSISITPSSNAPIPF